MDLEKQKDNIIPSGKLKAKRQRYPVTFVTVVFALVLVFFLVQGIILMNHHLASRINWRLPAEKHIVFIGASLVAYGIDDSMTESAINLANGGERYMFTFLKLRLATSMQNLRGRGSW